MKILSWNCCLPPWALRRRQRRPLIATTIVNANPDLICLQEVFLNKDATYLVKALAQKGYRHFFKYQDLLTISKLPIRSHYGVKFSNQGQLFSLAMPDVLYGKAFQLVKVQAHGQRLRIINTHLLSAYALAGKSYQQTRTSQTQEILKYLKAETVGTILVGDFNFKPGTMPYKTIVSGGYVDLSESVISTNKKIDYIFGKNLSTKGVKTTSKITRLSDHPYLTLEIFPHRRS